MSKKPELSARETFVLEDDMIDELDEMSWTSVIRDVEESGEQADAETSAQTNASDSDDLVFDALNAESERADGSHSDDEDNDDR